MVDWKQICKKCGYGSDPGNPWIIRKTDAKGNPIRPKKCPRCGNPNWWQPRVRNIQRRGDT